MLAECASEEELNRIEREKIAELQTQNPLLGYNVSKGGDGGVGHPPGEAHPMFGRRHCKETKRQMSESHKGKYPGETHRDDCRCWVCKSKDQYGEKNPMFGKTPRITQKMVVTARALGLANKGRVSSMKGKKMSPEARQNVLFAQRMRRVREREIAAIAQGDYRG